MRKYGLIGYPLGHSFSKTYFTRKFLKENIKDCQYLNFPVKSISELPGLINENKELAGFNVTIPYKEEVIPYLNHLDETAEKIGAVNTVKIIRRPENNELKGYNTDAYGFHSSILPCLKEHHKKALILGTGGSSKAIAYILDKLGVGYIYVSRSPRKENHISYSNVTRIIMDECKIIINTTPLGMYPDIDKCADIPYEFITKEHLIYDLVYNPENTVFLRKGAEKGAVTKNGLSMLHLQAEKAWEIWTG